MQTQVLLQPPPLLALARPRALDHSPIDLPRPFNPSRSSILAKRTSPPAQSGPSYSSIHTLLDDRVPRSGPRNHSPLTSPKENSISVPNQSHQPPHLSAPRPHLHSRIPSASLATPHPIFHTDPPVHVSPSPSPHQIHLTPLFSPPYSAQHNLDHFTSSATSHYPNMDRYPIANSAQHYIRGSDKYSHNQLPVLDQRRMSEPTYGSTASGHSTSTADLSAARYHQHQPHYSYAPSRSYAAPSSSPLRHSSDAHPPPGSPWKQDHSLPPHPYDSIELPEPLSPLNPTFSGGGSPPLMGMSGMTFPSIHEDYGPSPPDTATSASSDMHQQAHTSGGSSSPSNSKQYSFVSLPGNTVKKRPRRRFDEIERLYQCSWPDCAKAYGTLNHLNAHITMQKHGSKRSPNEFKELRKQWRKAKKEEVETRALEEVRQGYHQLPGPSQHSTSRHSISDVEYQSRSVRPSFQYAHQPEGSSHSIGSPDDLHDSLAYSRDVYSRRSQRYDSFSSSTPQHSEVVYPHPHHTHSASTSNITMSRLPANSTLLTPLPGYQSSSTSNAPSFNAYDSYDAYRSDSRTRTGYGSSGSHGDRTRQR